MSELLDNTSLSEELRATIEKWAAQYPSRHRQSALLPALLAAQKQHQGWLSRALIDAISDYLNVPRMTSYEVATFYTLFELKPIGRYKISICTNLSCMLSGCDKIVQYLKAKLQISFGETTPDGQFTLKEVECLGACINPPVLRLNEAYHENLTIEKVDKLLKNTLAPKTRTRQSRKLKD